MIKTHGDSNPKSPGRVEYSTWARIKRRCFKESNLDYDRYGGRGITMCKEWADNYESFLNDVGRRPSPNHSIDRIDNNGNYEPGNVRWATRSEQARNKRCNVNITCYGVTMCLAAWSETVGIHVNTLQNRINKGWAIDKALGIIHGN